MTQPPRGPGNPTLENLNRIAQQARERLAALQAQQEREGELLGRGQAAGGLVQVGCTSRDPLEELLIRPRAMRMPSEDLAAAIREAAREARADLRAQAADAARSLLDPEDDPIGIVRDPAAAAATLDSLSQLANGSAAEIAAVVDRFTAQFRR